MPHTRKEMLSWAKDVWEKITGHKEEEVGYHGWAARDKNGNLNFFVARPSKEYDLGWWTVDEWPCRKIKILNDKYPFIKWEDDEAIECELICHLKV